MTELNSDLDLTFLRQIAETAAQNSDSPKPARQLRDFHKVYYPSIAIALLGQLEAAEAALQRIREARANHPPVPECDRHTDQSPIVCGWKRAIQDIDQALKEPTK